MDNRYYKNVIAEMKPFFDENGFKTADNGEFLGENKAVKVEYNEERQMFLLNMAEITEGTVGEYKEVTAWLFDDSQSQKDAESVGVDFVNTVRDYCGIKAKKLTAAGQIDLPTVSKGSTLDVTGFTKKVLDIFPQFKDTYKEHIAKRGNFLYMEFFSETLIPQIGEVLTAGNKKSMKKLFDVIENGFLQGNKETVNIAVASVAAAIAKNPAIKENADAMLESDTNLKSAINAFVPVVLADKKIKAALIK